MVNDGDVVIGDSDGVLVVPIKDAASILIKAEAQDRKQRERDERARNGEFARLHRRIAKGVNRMATAPKA